ncbi:MAG: transcriptional repressor [Candidatus Roizmanbacteria bacterium]|nr:transcriptional repressor [Candidatus Roizmanbacteria bacterium]
MDENNKKILKEGGYRITPQRTQVLCAISTNPQSVEEIYETVSQGTIKTDLASVYRALTLFVKLKLVQAVNFGDGKDRYEILNTHKHHHHALCTRCGKITDVELQDGKKLEREASKKTNYRITGHSLEFFGICHNCCNA